MSKFDREIQKIINEIMNDYQDESFSSEGLKQAEKNRKRMLNSSSPKSGEVRNRVRK